MGKESDPSKIINAPLSELIKLAKKHTVRPLGEFKEYRPFQGVVEQHPFKAVAALSYEARKGSFPVEFWRTTVSHWPDATSERLRWLFARRIAQLPTKVVSDLHHDIPDWFHGNLPTLARSSLPNALKVWDEINEHYFRAGPEITKSAIVEMTNPSDTQKRSRRSYDHSINSPVGRMTETLLDMIGDLKQGRSEGIPIALRSRLERLLNAPGEGSDHAVCAMTRESC